MAITAATLTIHLDFDLNGEPVTHFLKAPAEVEELENHTGLTVHLHIDGPELAKAIAPFMARELASNSIRNTIMDPGSF